MQLCSWCGEVFVDAFCMPLNNSRTIHEQIKDMSLNQDQQLHSKGKEYTEVSSLVVTKLNMKTMYQIIRNKHDINDKFG